MPCVRVRTASIGAYALVTLTQLRKRTLPSVRVLLLEENFPVYTILTIQESTKVHPTVSNHVLAYVLTEYSRALQVKDGRSVFVLRHAYVHYMASR